MFILSKKIVRGKRQAICRYNKSLRHMFVYINLLLLACFFPLSLSFRNIYNLLICIDLSVFDMTRSCTQITGFSIFSASSTSHGMFFFHYLPSLSQVFVQPKMVDSVLASPSFVFDTMRLTSFNR